MSRFTANTTKKCLFYTRKNLLFCIVFPSEGSKDAVLRSEKKCSTENFSNYWFFQYFLMVFPSEGSIHDKNGRKKCAYRAWAIIVRVLRLSQRGDARKKTNARARSAQTFCARANRARARALRANFGARNTKRSIQRKEPYSITQCSGYYNQLRIKVESSLIISEWWSFVKINHYGNVGWNK